MIMKRFKNLLKNRSYPQKDTFKLCIIVDGADHLHETLGIIDARCEELSKTVLNAYHKYETMHESMDSILKECKHINEVVLALSVFHRYSELHRRKDELQSMLDI